MNLTKEQELHARVVQRAWEDQAFKQQLIDNPVATIEEFTGKKFNASGKTLVVRDQSNGAVAEAETDDSVIYFDIPAEPDLDELELTDAQLESVAGGFTIIIAGCALFAAGVAIGNYFDDDPPACDCDCP